MELALNLVEMRPFKLSHFDIFFYIIGYNQLLQFWKEFFRFYKHVGSIMKICIWLFNIYKINFGITWAL